MLATLLGLDHLVIAVRDLDAAAAEWRALGFTVSPRGLHSPHIGSANHTMMFGEDYLELLGVVAPQPHNEALRAFLSAREGLERAAFTTTDAAAGVAALRARGLAATGPVDFSRPVPLPDGGGAEARFTVFHFPREEAPAGLRVFACQHHTRDAVWVPTLQSHPNGVTRILSALVATEDPAGAAAHLARLIEGTARRDGAFHRVATGPGRADIAFAPRAAIAALARCAEEALPLEGGAGMVLPTRKPRPPALASGTAIIFEEAA
ncbi:VOC family protein [Sabulicella glaciei]|uniref:VOC family protein n=1 Tax=Sabulicella glaciei TaxID=2984948 RepID=A0ABT3NX55_9PROT|nr:VOC family protein [Roseococcus sp. MDT2-1-1]MCW8086740.1 VOC family protein [Roseococcus sp. MDT2-1-1]